MGRDGFIKGPTTGGLGENKKSAGFLAFVCIVARKPRIFFPGGGVSNFISPACRSAHVYFIPSTTKNREGAGGLSFFILLRRLNFYYLGGGTLLSFGGLLDRGRLSFGFRERFTAKSMCVLFPSPLSCSGLSGFFLGKM